MGMLYRVNKNKKLERKEEGEWNRGEKGKGGQRNGD
jgi:hypothetical protein